MTTHRESCASFEKLENAFAPRQGGAVSSSGGWAQQRLLLVLSCYWKHFELHDSATPVTSGPGDTHSDATLELARLYFSQ